MAERWWYSRGDSVTTEELCYRRKIVAKFTDSLRGYAFEIMKRDGFKCRYCGLDGQASYDSWLAFSWDHLLPKGHPKRDDPNYIVAACNFCNTADNRYFDLAARRGLSFDGLSPEQLVEQRKPFVEVTRNAYYEFWTKHVVNAP